MSLTTALSVSSFHFLLLYSSQDTFESLCNHMGEKLIFLTLLIIYLHFKLFSTLFYSMLWEKELRNIFGAHDYHFDFLSKQVYEGKFLLGNLSEGHISLECIQLIFAQLDSHRNARKD